MYQGLGKYFSEQLHDHLTSAFSRGQMMRMSQQFHRDGIVVFSDSIPTNIHRAVRVEALRLLGDHAERRDLKLRTTDDTERKMSVVPSKFIAAHSQLIVDLYRSEPMRSFLQNIADEELFSCPSKDEEFLISRHERPGDHHGWHWGDFSFALIWILETPPIEHGGLLQCIPHTNWNKENPQINKYLLDNAIRTYGFKTGDVYFLRTDTTLHRTIPLNREATRIMLNMTWASRQELQFHVDGDDRWWSDEHAAAITSIA